MVGHPWKQPLGEFFLNYDVSRWGSWIEKRDLTEKDLFVCSEVVRGIPQLEQVDRQLLLLLLLEYRHRVASGDTRLGLDDLQITVLAKEAADLGLDAGRGALCLRQIVDSNKNGDLHPWSTVIGPVGSSKPMVVHDRWLYSHRLWSAEEAITRHLARSLHFGVDCSPPLGSVDLSVLSKEQRRAIELALGRRFSVITGGAGTGKTSVVFSLLRMLVTSGLATLGDIVLAAPTGKAADRLSSALRAGLSALRQPTFADRALLNSFPRPQTLHRLLGYSPVARRYAHHSRSPLGQTWVVVDESSMIGVEMMSRLVSALRDDAHLILIGDANQLPSIEAGAMFSDISRCLPQCTTKLSKNFRATDSGPRGSEGGRQIAEFSEDLLRSRFRFRPDVIFQSDSSELSFKGVEFVPPEKMGSFLEVWCERFAWPILREQLERERNSGQGLLFSPEQAEDWLNAAACAQLLCVTKKGPWGVEGLNRWFASRSLDLSLTRDERFVPGTPIIIGRNDYRLGLYNGDTGVVIRGVEGQLSGLFLRGDSHVCFPLSILEGLIDHGFAISVHKAQGSEYDHVALVMPPAANRLLTRQLIYTAVTRARRSVTVIGGADLFASSLLQDSGRQTGLAEKLVLEQG